MTQRPPARLGVAFVLLACGLLAAGADEPPPPTLTPVRVFTLPASDSNAVALSADGQTLYHVVDVRHVNAWALLAYRWPEILALTVFLAAPFVALRLGRRAARAGSRVPGEPYCRRCNYRLTGLTADRCPECGVDVTAGRRNRVVAAPPWPARRRVAVAAVAAAGLCLLVFVPVRFALVRDALHPHPTAGRFRWNSRALYRLAESRNWQWALRHSEHVAAVVERSTAGGRVLREFQGLFEDPRIGTLKLAPDGKTLWANDLHCLRSWDVRSGRPGRTLAFPEIGWSWLHAKFWIGPDAALAQTHTPGPRPLAAWDLKTGRPEPIPPELELDETLVTALPDAVHVLVAPPYPDRLGDLHVVNRRTGRDVPPTPIHVPLVLDTAMLAINPQVSRDGRRIFPSGADGRQPGTGRPTVRGWSLETGRPLPPVGPFPTKLGIPIGATPIDVNGRRLLTWYDEWQYTGSHRLLEIWDVDRGRRLARLAPAPATNPPLEPLLAADGRTLAVVHLSPYAPGSGGPRRVSVFDLSALPAVK